MLRFVRRWLIVGLAGPWWMLCGQDQVVAPVSYSTTDPFFTEPFTLELSTVTPDTTIRYSTDGRVPGLFNSFPYLGAIEISETTRICAVAKTSDGAVSLPVYAQFVQVSDEMSDFSSPLPLLVIENFGQGDVPLKKWNQTGEGVKQVERQLAHWYFFERDEDGRSRLHNTDPDHASRLGIRVRGAFSSSFPRKPYSVETWDDNNQSTNVRPLGLPPESDWVLYSPNADRDRTLVYNTWLYALSRTIGRYAARFKFVETFLHNDGEPLSMNHYAGLYVLMEKVKRDGNRVDFPRLSDDGTTGGWLLSINRMDPEPPGGFPAGNGVEQPQFFHTAGPDRVLRTPPNQSGVGDDIPRQYNAFINFESPNGYQINPVQRARIENWFVEFEDALYDQNYRDPELGYPRYLDPGSFVDYFILHDLTRNTDGLLISMWIYVDGSDGKLHMGPVWDYDLAYRDSPGSNLLLNKNRLWYGRLWEDPDFEQAYVDRWQELRRTHMSDDMIDVLIDRQSAEITDEVARRHGIANYAERLISWKRWIHDRAGALDDRLESPPVIRPPGGFVNPGTNVALSAGTIFSPRTIYYTVDGSDPRAPGGAISESAQLFEDPISIDKSLKLRARVLDDGVWSGLSEEGFFVGTQPAGPGTVVISKIHYHPANPTPGEQQAGVEDDDAFEFIELLNVSGLPVHLGGSALVDGVRFRFGYGDHSVLGPGARVVLARSLSGFKLRFGSDVEVAGQYEGKLANDGERLRWSGFDGKVLDEVRYRDEAPWPESADGAGFALVRLRGSEIPASESSAWRPSVVEGGRPGESEALVFPGGDLLEYAAGGPGKNTQLNSAWVDGVLVLSFSRDLAVSDVIVDVETSLDLDHWAPVSTTFLSRRYVNGTIVRENHALSEFLNGRGGFIRLRAIATP